MPRETERDTAYIRQMHRRETVGFNCLAWLKEAVSDVPCPSPCILTLAKIVDGFVSNNKLKSEEQRPSQPAPAVAPATAAATGTSTARGYGEKGGRT